MAVLGVGTFLGAEMNIIRAEADVAEFYQLSQAALAAPEGDT